MTWVVYPSDLSFLYDRCRRCFYLKVVKGRQLPERAMPKIFTKIDLLMKAFFREAPPSQQVLGLPEGEMLPGEVSVEACFPPPGVPWSGRPIRLVGKPDAVLARADGAGYVVVDYKTSEPTAAYLPLYVRQLAAYAYALTEEVRPDRALRPITHVGLLIFSPERFGREGLLGKFFWQAWPFEREGFLRWFSEEVAQTLIQDRPPPPGRACMWCRFLAAGGGGIEEEL